MTIENAPPRHSTRPRKGADVFALERAFSRAEAERAELAELARKHLQYPGLHFRRESASDNESENT